MRCALADVAGPDCRGQTVLDAVADAHGLLGILDGDGGQHRPEDFLARDAHVVAARRRRPSARRSSRPSPRARACRRPARSRLRACPSRCSRARSSSGPRRRSRRCGSPDRADRPAAWRGSAATTFSSTWSRTLSSTIRREAAVHISPWLKKIAAAAVAAARSRSGQSARMMFGDLPPHSSHTRFMFDWPEYCSISLPVRVEPVKPMQSTSMCSASAWPAVWPKPGSTLNTPSGMPASAASAARRIAVSGDFSDGLRMNELPAASAGPIFHAAMISGKFHGTIAATTPIGSRVIRASCVVRRRRDFVVHLVDGLGVPGDAARRRRDVHGEAVADRLAHVERLEQRQLVAVREDQLGEALQHALAFARRLPRPDAAARTRGARRPRRGRRPPGRSTRRARSRGHRSG